MGAWKSVQLKHYLAYPIIIISLIIQRNLATKIRAKWESGLTAVWLKRDPPVYMHRIIKNNESSILPLFQQYSQKSYKCNSSVFSWTLVDSLGVSAEMGRIWNLCTSLYNFEIEKTINLFLRKEWQIISNFLYPYLILSENLLPICHLNPLSYLWIFLPKA